MLRTFYNPEGLDQGRVAQGVVWGKGSSVGLRAVSYCVWRR
jgi:hypothetical protein